MNFLRSTAFQFITFLSTKHWNPACGYFAVVASISCSSKLLSNLSAKRCQKATFQRRVKKPGFVKPRCRLKKLSTMGRKSSSLSSTDCVWKSGFFSACQRAGICQNPKLCQRAMTNNRLKPDCLSNRDKYWQQRRKLHAGADCGRFPVKPKNNMSGKMPTENHCCRAWRVADVMAS